MTQPQRNERMVIALSQEQRSLLMRGMGAFAVVLVALLAVGTFADLQIAQAVYAPDNPLVIFVSTLGLIPMVYPACILLGVLMQRSLASQKPRVLCVVGAVVCMVLAVLFGALITGALLSMLEGFGGIERADLAVLALPDRDARLELIHVDIARRELRHDGADLHGFDVCNLIGDEERDDARARAELQHALA